MKRKILNKLIEILIELMGIILGILILLGSILLIISAIIAPIINYFTYSDWDIALDYQLRYEMIKYIDLAALYSILYGLCSMTGDRLYSRYWRKNSNKYLRKIYEFRNGADRLS